MRPQVILDPVHARVHVRASGQWIMQDADDFHAAMSKVVAWSAAHPGQPLAVLSDLDGLVLHTAEIAERVAETVRAMKRIRMSRYALVVPSYLMRMQCRRLLDGIAHEIFGTRGEAIQWLGWPAEAPGVAGAPLGSASA